MNDNGRKYKIVYLTPALYMAGGVERVLSLKANYFADQFGYDITIILTEGKDKTMFYPLSNKVKVINLDINFEELWTCSFLKKIFVYLKKQHLFKKSLTAELMRIRPDITISLLRREINFITSVKDGSKKVGELHINRKNYRNFEEGRFNIFNLLFSKLWMYSLVKKLKKLERLVVLTDYDRLAWKELDNVVTIPNPLSISPSKMSPQTEKRVIAVGRYCHEKGYDFLLSAWSKVQIECPDWQLVIFGDGNRTEYDQLIDRLNIDRTRCKLNARTSDVNSEYVHSSLAVCSSRFEGFGLVIVEAMACGLPVVSFDCPWGPRSIIDNGNDGVLVENGNIDELAINMVKLMKNPETRIEMANRAVQNVHRYEMRQIAMLWKSLFDSL
jgi:glycosyltransferase involved in cell wall biosynthesis